MREMTGLIKKIPLDKFSNELRIDILRTSRNHPENKELSSLFNIVNCELTDTAFKIMLEDKNFCYPKNQIENIEILARINDIKFIRGDKNKLDCIKKSVNFYFITHKKTNDLQYLIRALELIRKVKSVFEQKLNEFENIILQIFYQLDSSYYQVRLIENSSFLMQDKSLNEITEYSLNQLNNNYESNNYSSASDFITILNKLKYFDKNKFKIQMAICFEKEGDFYISKKKPKTYYPTILTTYQKALNEVKGIHIDEEFKSRLEQKIKKEQKIYAEMFTKIDIPNNSKLNVSKLVASQNINDFKSGYNFFMDCQIIDSELLKPTIEENNKNFFEQYFKDFVRITDKGTVSGKSNNEDFKLNFSRDIYRKNMILIFREIKSIMDCDKQISLYLVSKMVMRCNSEFIPKGREYFFIEGIYYGFQNNFILASHILIPQIENSLKNLIELNGRNTTKLSEEIQNDNTLGSLLNIDVNNKMLDGICDRNLILELNNFLIDGNSVNFRNRLCHGLLSPDEMDFYGIYLWWLTLKMVKQTDEYFPKLSN